MHIPPFFFNHLTDSLVNVKTYVGEDGKLHFVDSEGADTVLNFSSGFSYVKVSSTYSNYNRIHTVWVSNDNSTWTEIGSFTINWNASETQTFKAK